MKLKEINIKEIEDMVGMVFFFSEKEAEKVKGLEIYIIEGKRIYNDLFGNAYDRAVETRNFYDQTIWVKESEYYKRICKNKDIL